MAAAAGCLHACIAEADFAVELYLFGFSNDASIPFMCDSLRLSACIFRAAPWPQWRYASRCPQAGELYMQQQALPSQKIIPIVDNCYTFHILKFSNTTFHYWKAKKTQRARPLRIIRARMYAGKGGSNWQSSNAVYNGQGVETSGPPESFCRQATTRWKPSQKKRLSEC
jgi:hypothetical protein